MRYTVLLGIAIAPSRGNIGIRMRNVLDCGKKTASRYTAYAMIQNITSTPSRRTAGENRETANSASTIRSVGMPSHPGRPRPYVNHQSAPWNQEVNGTSCPQPRYDDRQASSVSVYADGSPVTNAATAGHATPAPRRRTPTPNW